MWFWSVIGFPTAGNASSFDLLVARERQVNLLVGEAVGYHRFCGSAVESKGDGARPFR